MKTFTSICFSTALLALTAGGSFAQSNILGTPNTRTAARTVCADNSGNYYTGAMQNKLGLLIKKDSLNNVVWSVNYGFAETSAATIHTTSLQLIGDTLFGCGYSSDENQEMGGFYFKANAQTGAFYWIKHDVVSRAFLCAMRYANGKFFLVGGFLATTAQWRGKVLAVSSQTGNLIWETASTRVEYPTPNNGGYITEFTDATEMVNGKMYITGWSLSHGGNFNICKPILIGIDDTGAIFLTKYYERDQSRFDEGETIRYDGNKLLLTLRNSIYFNQYTSWTPTVPYSMVMKCDLQGNIEYCRSYHFEPYNQEAYISSVNITNNSYVFYGNNWDSGSDFIFKTSKSGVFQKGVTIPARPHTYYLDEYSYNVILGTSAYVNQRHYFTATMELVPATGFIVEQLIADEELNLIGSCSATEPDTLVELDELWTAFDGVLQDTAASMSFHPGVILSVPPDFDACANISLQTTQHPTCAGADIEAQATGFHSPAYYWSNGGTDSTTTATTTDTLFLRVLDIFCCELIDTIVPVIHTDSLSVLLPADTLICQQAASSYTFHPLVNATNPITYLWDDGTTTASRTVSASGTYWVEIADSCHAARDSIVVQFGQLPVITGNPAVSVCEDDFPVVLAPQISAGSTISWQDGYTTATRPAPASGNYVVTAQNQCGITSFLITVTSFNLPSVTMVAAVDTCLNAGGSFVLQPVLTDVDNVLWSDGSSANQLTVSQSGIYTVYGSNSCGLDSAQTIVQIGQLPVITGNPAVSACEDDFPVLLAPQISAGSTISWQDGYTTATRPAAAAGNYVVTAQNQCGITSFLISVTSLNLPSVTMVAAVDTCLNTGAGFVLQPVLTDVDNVLWSDGSSANQLTVSQPGAYTVYGSNSCGSDSAQTVVNIRSFPQLYLPATLDTCFEPGVPFTYTAHGTAGNYAWSSGSQTATEQIADTGAYTVTLSNSCGSVQKTIVVNRLSNIRLTVPDDSVLYCGNLFPVNGLGIDSNYPFEILNEQQQVQGEVLSATGWYLIHGYNACGSLWDSIYIDLQNNVYFYLPNAFTPNGDVHNGYYTWQGENAVVREFHIYDRWGEMVFNGGNPLGWDGTSGGKECPIGIYTVLVVLENCQGIPEEKTGFVALVR